MVPRRRRMRIRGGDCLVSDDCPEILLISFGNVTSYDDVGWGTGFRTVLNPRELLRKDEP